jgi:Acetyltransferase (GNAT) domain
VGATDDEWDAFLAAHPDGHHEQSSRYVVERAPWGFTGARIVSREGSTIVGGVQAIVRRTPIGKAGHIQRGPIAVDDRTDILDDVVSKLDALAKKQRWRWARVDTFPAQEPAREALCRAGYRDSAMWYSKVESLIVPLSRSDDEILSHMKKKGRYGLRKAGREGVEVEINGPLCLEAFHPLHAKTAEHQGFPIFPLSYYQYLQRVFGPDKMPTIVARHNGQAIAAVVNFVVGGRSYYGWGGISRAPEHGKLKANYLCHWRGMQWAREHGCSHYDLVGVTEFKAKLADESIEWPPPQRKFFGLVPYFRRAALDRSWSYPFLRRAVRRAVGRQPPMPY